ncbi:MAG: hypothetical protein KGJ94_03095 [Xanthomonadaceae bacterium]|jgi:hypothetical protein|nr:hypothetical protein [Xanthomonadaceae bacterium]
MARYSHRRYQVHTAILMAVYAMLLVWLWPQMNATHATGLKIVLALTPLLPVVAVVALMARYVMASDELQQRITLLALGIATSVVSAASLVGAFLAMAHVWVTDGSVLVWIFPSLCFVFGLSRILLTRRMAGTWKFWAC